MGRRSLFSVSSINRILSAARAQQRRNENSALINAQSGPKQLPPEYAIAYIDFKETTRVAKIMFRKTVYYRTVERYVQQNYEKYPIYSDWKTKTSTFQRSVKLTNAVLESLEAHSDEFIRQFAFEIITNLANDELVPSWYIKECISEDYRAKFKDLEKIKTDKWTTLEKDVADLNALIQSKNIDLQANEKIRHKNIRKFISLLKKLEKTFAHKASLIKSIFSFCIYRYFGSQKRLAILDKKRERLSKTLDSLSDASRKIKAEISLIEDEIKNKKRIFEEEKQQIENTVRDLRAECSKKLQEVTPLPTSYIEEEKFTPLKKLLAWEYEKIVGCYIIRNTENQRCYVGQSKDVIKRLKQHFHGTVPNNIIFAEDYYSALPENRDSLFEFKIYPCQTKDELDRTEKQLIEEYDAYNSGYNGTSGNT